MNKIKKFLLSFLLAGGLAFGVSSGVMGDGIDLSKVNNNYGLVASISAQTGKVYSGWMYIVCSGHSLAKDTPSAGDFKRPYATLDYAIGRSAANVTDTGGPNDGDLIICLAGHTETVIAAAGLDVDSAGVTIVGLGNGSDRATVNFTTVVGAVMDIDAANVTIMNMLFTGGFDATTGVIDVNSADFSMINCEYRAVTGQATDVIRVADAADRLLIDGLVFRGAAADGGDSAILFEPNLVTGGCEDVIIRNSSFYGNWDTGCIENITGGLLRINIHDVSIWTEGAEDLAINLFGTSTGSIGPNVYVRVQDHAANMSQSIVGSDTHFFRPVEMVNLDDETSIGLGDSGVNHHLQSTE